MNPFRASRIAAAAVGLAAGVGGTLLIQKAAGPPPSLAQQLRDLKPGSDFLIPPGEYGGEVVLHNPQRLTLRGGGRVTFDGGPDYALKISGGRDVTLRGLAFTGSSGHGCMAVNVDGLTVDHCIADGNQVNGFLTGDCRRVTVTGCEAKDNRSHNLYLSQSGADYRIEGNDFGGGAGRCSLQINAHPGLCKGVVVRNNDLRGPKNASLQLAGVTGAVIAGNQVGGGRVDTVLWEDQGGKAFACSDVDLTGQDGKVKVHPFCKNIRLRPGALLPWTN